MRSFATRFIAGFLSLLLVPTLAFAQQTGTVSGQVTDAETGETLPGATVQVTDTGLGAATDTEGRYEISNVPAGEQTVQVSFVGYQQAEETIQVQANQTTTVNFELQAETEQLGEVTVTGYRAQSKRVETGASASLNTDEIENTNYSSPDAILQGRAAGVRVTSTSGQPGSGFQVRVRNSASINAGEDPLYIIDGVQVSPDDGLALAQGNPLASIAPSDIQSIEVLKDAAAASIYGAQAANGVVIISTKQGRAGQTNINFSTQLGGAERAREYEVMNSEQFLNYRARALSNTTGLPVGDARPIVEDVFGSPEVNTNWQDQVFRRGLTQTYNLSARGGDEQTQFFVSGRFTRDEGQVIDSQFLQGGLRANLNHQISERLAVEAKVNLSTSEYEGTISNGPFINSPFWAAQFIPPTAPVFAEPGNPSSGFNLSPNSVFSFHPVAQEEFNTRESIQNQIISNVALNYSITDAISSRTYAGISHQDIGETDYDDPRLPPNAGSGGGLSRFADQTTSFNASQTFTFDRVFNDVHSVSALAGGEYKYEAQEDFSTRGEGFVNFLFRTLSSAANPVNVGAYSTEYRQLSAFGNVEYTFDNRYQIATTLRYDGSSRFGADRRYGLFGTASAFWRLSNEAFLQEADFLDDLTLRASYGVTGNSAIQGIDAGGLANIGNFLSRRLFSGVSEYNGSPGIRQVGLGNNELTWEENWETNVGLDYSLFGGRLSGSFDVFRRDRTSLLLNRDLPVDSGFGSFLDNVGEVRSEGVEANISTVNIDAGFTWETSFNIAFVRNEVLELVGNDDRIVVGGLVYEVGEPIAQYEYTRWAGVNPANGRPMYLDGNGELTYQPAQEADQKLVGNTSPDFYGGLSNTFSAFGFTLDVFFQFDYGRTTLNNTAFFSDVGYFPYNKRTELLRNIWEEPGDVAEYPAPYGSVLVSGGTTYPDGTTEGAFSQRYMEDASYIRLEQVQLSYQIPRTLLRSVGFRNASLFVRGTNLVTFTEYTGPDPELVGTGLGEYPPPRQYTAGFRIGL